MISDAEIQLRPAPARKQTAILFDSNRYSAFPQVIRLEGDELLLSFRQAPRSTPIRHTHPSSIITLLRSYDSGRTWDRASSTQIAAGGGQELGLIYLGKGRVAGALAWHEVVPEHEGERTGLTRPFPSEYPFRTPGSFWAWSDTWGFTWRPDHVRFLGAGTMPCANPVRVKDGHILCPVYSFVADTPDPTMMSSVLHVSDDDGLHWSPPTVMAAGEPGVRGFCEPAVVELSAGHILALHRIETKTWGPERCFRTNESYDGGRTWSAPVDTGILSGACPRLMKLSDGRLLLTFGRRFEPYGLRAMISNDGGRTWGNTAWELRPAPNGDQGYTSSVEVSPGRIFTVSYAQNARGITGIVGTFWRLPG